MTQITRELANNVLAAIDGGIAGSIKQSVNRHLSVTEAIRFGLGMADYIEDDFQPNATPTGISAVLLQMLRSLGEARWSSNQARAAGMRRLVLACLGSTGLDTDPLGSEVAHTLTTYALSKAIPKALRAAAAQPIHPVHQHGLTYAAAIYELDQTIAANIVGFSVATAARDSIPDEYGPSWLTCNAAVEACAILDEEDEEDEEGVEHVAIVDVRHLSDDEARTLLDVAQDGILHPLDGGPADAALFAQMARDDSEAMAVLDAVDCVSAVADCLYHAGEADGDQHRDAMLREFADYALDMLRSLLPDPAMQWLPLADN